MHNQHLSFAKIVATPTATAWSQAYNAGSLFAVVSLVTDHAPEKPLNSLGKEVLSILESEFFTLENKDLQSIKKAVVASLEHIPSTVHTSIALAYIKDQILYLILSGAGSITMKRHDSLGPLLRNDNTDTTLKSASGYLENNDIILLQTDQFTSLITNEALTKALELTLPNDIAETLTPDVHKTENGGAAAIILTGKGFPTHHPIPSATKEVEKAEPHHHEGKEEITPAKNEPHEEKKIHTEERVEKVEKEEEQEDQKIKESKEEESNEKEDEEISEESQTEQTETNIVVAIIETIKNTLTKRPLSVFKGNRKGLLLGVIAIVLIVILAFSIFTQVQKRETEQRKETFTKVYTAAEQDYEEGSGLLNLNPQFARDELLSAKKTIDDNLSQFPKNTEERTQLEALLQKVQADLSQSAQIKTVETKKVDADSSPILAAQLEQPGILYTAQDEERIYSIDTKSVKEIKNNKTTTLITNDNDWSSVKGFGAFNGNIYVLDTKEGMLKFVSGSKGYGKSSYFTGTAPDLSKSVDLAIDGSIWILSRDGSIAKYTKGQQETFSIKGLDTALKSPTKIYTDKETANVYILDKGNSRIVVLQKNGAFKTQYHSPSLKTATSLSIDEKNKKAYIIDKDSLWEVPLQ